MAAARLDLPAPPPASRLGRPLPWVAIAGGAGAAGTGAAFALAASSSGRELDGVAHPLSEVDAIQRRIDQQRAAAGIAFAVAGLSLALGALLFAAD
jgi:hypothetical protein